MNQLEATIVTFQSYPNPEEGAEPCIDVTFRVGGVQTQRRFVGAAYSEIVNAGYSEDAIFKQLKAD